MGREPDSWDGIDRRAPVEWVTKELYASERDAIVARVEKLEDNIRFIVRTIVGLLAAAIFTYLVTGHH
ncbi:MAG: hypothetical protein ACM3UO_00340 [Bacillota bacterium]